MPAGMAESDDRHLLRHAHLWINRIKDRTNIENARSVNPDQPREVLPKCTSIEDR